MELPGYITWHLVNLPSQTHLVSAIISMANLSSTHFSYMQFCETNLLVRVFSLFPTTALRGVALIKYYKNETFAWLARDKNSGLTPATDV